MCAASVMLIGATIGTTGEAVPIGAEDGAGAGVYRGCTIEIAVPVVGVGAGRYWEGGGAIGIAGAARGVYVGGYWESAEIAASIGVVDADTGRVTVQ